MLDTYSILFSYILINIYISTYKIYYSMQWKIKQFSFYSYEDLYKHNKILINNNHYLFKYNEI